MCCLFFSNYIHIVVQAHGSMSENIEQVARIQKLLASSTKVRWNDKQCNNYE